MSKYILTGVAGFIGSHIAEKLLNDGHTVIGVDDLSLGKVENMKSFCCRAKFIGVEIKCSNPPMIQLGKGVDAIIHQAAWGSVPRSIENPTGTIYNNVISTLAVFESARINNIPKVVFASSSSVYGDNESTKKKEEITGKAISPYATSKVMCEEIAEIYNRTYGIDYVALRYFNVYGSRQNSEGEFAPVIPKWIKAMRNNEPIYINGDGSTSRAFTHVDDVVNANMLALKVDKPFCNRPYNIAGKSNISLNEIVNVLDELIPENESEVIYKDFKKGDIKFSCPDLSKSLHLLGYNPKVSFIDGIKKTLGEM